MAWQVVSLKAIATRGGEQGEQPQKSPEQIRLLKKLKKTRREHKKIRKLIRKDGLDEKDTLVMLKALLSITLSMIPVAEQQYYKYSNERAAYAFNALVSQTREIANDMRSIRDLEEQYGNIVRFIADRFRLIAQNMVDEAYKTKKSIMSMMGSDAKPVLRKIDALIHHHALYLTESLKALEAIISDYMLEPHPKEAKKVKKIKVSKSRKDS